MKVYDTIFWNYASDAWCVSIGKHGTGSFQIFPVQYSEPLEKFLDKDSWEHILWEVDLDFDTGKGKVIRIIKQLPSPLPPISKRPQHESGLPWKTLHSRSRTRSDWDKLPVWEMLEDL